MCFATRYIKNATQGIDLSLSLNVKITCVNCECVCIIEEKEEKSLHKRKGKGKGKRERGNRRSVYYTIAYQFCRAEEIRGPVISFPDSTLKEEKRSGVLSSFAGKGGEKEGERNQLNKASYFSIINFRSYLLYVASSMLSSQNLMEN